MEGDDITPLLQDAAARAARYLRDLPARPVSPSPQAVERLTALGASVVNIHDGDEGRWVLMADPEGNEFDVS